MMIVTPVAITISGAAKLFQDMDIILRSGARALYSLLPG
jgi:hypothetical protein